MPAKIEKNTVEEGLLRKKVEFNANQSRILKAGARALIPILVKNTPKSDRRGHARDHIAISNVKTDRGSGEKYVDIGYTKGYAHRIHATEFGTMYQRPQLWITKTEKSNRQLVYSAMLTAMKRSLK
ncbi:HK97-gp10 family putative phage morphogenesis protein [Staphylococcus coagulans]|uniref:HK97-gp10 family putative phage morphogenesis protein n=1 Tax=Staphylococcus coagulans TaxID=74706 RepID=UPI0033651642